MPADRSSFKGRTDKYITTLLLGDVGFMPFPAVDRYFNDHDRDLTFERLARYQKYWRFYRGNHFPNASQSRRNTRRLTVNFCGPLIDLSVDFLFSKGWKVLPTRGQEDQANLLSIIWNKSRKDFVSYQMGQHGSIGGDAFLCPYWLPLNRPPTAQELNTGQGTIEDVIARLRVGVYDAKYVHPLHNATTGDLDAVLIQYPDRVVEGSPYYGAREYVVRSIDITPKEIKVYEDETLLYTTPNPLGKVHVVHVRNHMLATSYYGQSDMEWWTDVQEVYDETIHHYQEIIRYHANPVTIVFGNPVGQALTKGPDKVWTGLSEKARVENLEMRTDLGAMNLQLDRLTEAIHRLAQTPQVALAGMQNVSDTSQAALETLYLPLVGKTRRKHKFYGEGIIQCNQVLLEVIERVFRVSGYVDTSLPPELRYETVVAFPNALPRDEQRFVDLLARKIELRLQSRAGAIRALGEDDPEAAAFEVMGDRVSDLLEDVERARASSSEEYIPNLLSLGADSTIISSGMLDTYEKLVRRLSDDFRATREAERASREAQEDPEEEDSEGQDPEDTGKKPT